MSGIDDAVFMQPDEHGGVVCGPARLERVGRAVERDRRDLTLGFCARRSSSGCNAGSPASRPKSHAVTMNHDFHEIRIFESRRRPGECRFIESPAGRPFAPQHPAQFAAVFCQAFTPTFGLEEMLIPADTLKRRRDGMPLLTHIDHVVARVGYQAANAFRPQRCRHTGGVASPIETTEDGAFQTENVSKLDDVAATGGLLPAPHDVVGKEAGWAESASIWGKDPCSCSRQDRSRLHRKNARRRGSRGTGLPASHWLALARYRRPAGHRSRCFSLYVHSWNPSPVTVETNARRLASIRSGCSKAAKCPPDDISLQ